MAVNDPFSTVMGGARGSGRSEFLARFFPYFSGEQISDRARKSIEDRIRDLMGHANPVISWLDPNLISVVLEKPHGRSAGFLRSHLALAYQGSLPDTDCVYFHGVHWDDDENVPKNCLVADYVQPLPKLPAANSE